MSRGSGAFRVFFILGIGCLWSLCFDGVEILGLVKCSLLEGFFFLEIVGKIELLNNLKNFVK